MTQETIVRLKIISENVTPEFITKATGLSPDRCWHIGDYRPHTTIVEKVCGWVLGSGLPESANLDEHVRALLSVVKPHAQEIKRLSKNCMTEVSCVVYSDSSPELNFDASVVGEIAKIGAGLDIDVYVSSDAF